MKLIITEKPSVARDFANALYAKLKDGYYEASNYYITWSYGHLVDIDDSILPKRWSLLDLPILLNPKDFRYVERNDQARKQLNVIRKLLKRVDTVIIATDFGREGELIARLILYYLSWKGKTLRFWTSSALTKEVILKELQNLKPSSLYDDLFYAALARQHADFLVGINFTRYVTLTVRESLKPQEEGVWSVGRVQTPTLALVVERDRTIENFKKVYYYEVVAKFKTNDGFEYEGKLRKRDLIKGEKVKKDLVDVFSENFTFEEAEKIVSELKPFKKGEVVEVSSESKKELPPFPFSLPTLQKEAGLKYKLSAEKVHEIAQKLYQDYKVISYPRTESEKLPPNLLQDIKRLLGIFGYPEVAKEVSLEKQKRVFDTSKLTDHHAIIPLRPLAGSVAENSLEKKVFNLIVKRFVASFMPPYRYVLYTIKTKLGNYVFTTKLKKDIELGWKSLYSESYSDDFDKRDRDLSKFSGTILALKKGDIVLKVNVFVDKKETEPPSRYKDATLISKMKLLGLGTSATRDQIIETLIKRSYLKRDSKGYLMSTSKGRSLIDFLKKRGSISTNGNNPFHLITSAEMTSSWEKSLEEIYKNKLGKSGYLHFIKKIREEMLLCLCSTPESKSQ